ncbi:helix-turn-helix domain-containing protein [Flavobacterium sp. LS1R49]|uniref:Helix-turn-helix domain-containing protein n=1 Tax=Flavobacterium shii TaxID=2987687 RepID=A0A9X2YT67_9FLAO|nr:helix-turn-helix domain-containing protein [Flavobacterium shii]MCV9926298.1 helix-turn-helix domain-containing protein [Flavobacterium shii]
MIKVVLLLLSLCLVEQINAQKTDFRFSDTLRDRSYDYLYERIEKWEKDSSKQLLYLQYFLLKAKQEKNAKEIINGYRNYLFYLPEKLKLVYADSMISTAVKSKDNALIGSAYLSKGIVYYGQKKHRRALDNYLVANNFISQTNDQYLIYKVKYSIASIKYYLGFYNEAISLFRECIDYFKTDKENDRAYLNSIHSLGLCYNKIGNYGLCTDINNLGLVEGKRLGNEEMKDYFIHSEGINEYFKNNLSISIKKITYALPTLLQNKDFGNEAVGYFYIGKSYWDLKKTNLGLSYFKRVDNIFEKKGYIRPDLRENFEILIDHYKSKKDLKLQLHYIRKLIKADSILNKRYRYLSGRIHKEYDTKQLLAEKENIETSLENRKYNDLILTSIIVGLFSLLLFIAYRYIRNKRVYKRKFDELMKKNEMPKTEGKSIQSNVLDINPETVNSVLSQLEKFEREKKFLEKDLTSIKLAVAFDSNARYLSKIIQHYRGKKFVEYINDLKVDYLISQLKENKQLRKYTNKALAEEVGFSSTQRFANAFFARTGMPTAYFIEEIKTRL